MLTVRMVENQGGMGQMQKKFTLSLTDDELVRKIHEYRPHMRSLSHIFRDACIADIERVDRLHALRQRAQECAEYLIPEFIDVEGLTTDDVKLLAEVLPEVLADFAKNMKEKDHE
jgi:hypothetical protein